jgi:hypothetical protein
MEIVFVGFQVPAVRGMSYKAEREAKCQYTNNQLCDCINNVFNN